MDLRVSLSTFFRMRLTTLAGISSMTSTVSSRNISSNTSESSLSVKPVMSFSCRSGSISAKVSAASSLGSSRNSRKRLLSSRSSSSSRSIMHSAMSAGLRVSRYRCRGIYCLACSSSRIFSEKSKFVILSLLQVWFAGVGSADKAPFQWLTIETPTPRAGVPAVCDRRVVCRLYFRRPWCSPHNYSVMAQPYIFILCPQKKIVKKKTVIPRGRTASVYFLG